MRDHFQRRNLSPKRNSPPNYFTGTNELEQICGFPHSFIFPAALVTSLYKTGVTLGKSQIVALELKGHGFYRSLSFYASMHRRKIHGKLNVLLNL